METEWHLYTTESSNIKTGMKVGRASQMELAQCYEEFKEESNRCLTSETAFPGNTRLGCGMRSGAAWLGETERYEC